MGRSSLSEELCRQNCVVMGNLENGDYIYIKSTSIIDTFQRSQVDCLASILLRP